MKVTLSGIGIVDGSGKLGGTVFQHGRYGVICRRQFKPTTSGWAYKETNTQKASFASIATSWKALTDSQQTGWIAGAPGALSGFQYFLQVNLSYYPYFGFFLNDVPTPVAIGSATLISLAFSRSTNTYHFKYTGILGANSNQIILYFLNNLSPGVHAPKLSQFRLGEYAALGSGIINQAISPQIKGVFPTIGTKSFLQWKVLDTSTGLLSAASFASTIIT